MGGDESVDTVIRVQQGHKQMEVKVDAVNEETRVGVKVMRNTSMHRNQVGNIEVVEEE